MVRFVFQDTETSSADTRFGSVAQYAGMALGEDLRTEIGRLDVKGRLPAHVLPHPKALQVTRTDPVELENRPLSHLDLIKTVHAQMKAWSPAIFISYNGMDFDEEILRSEFYQHLLDIYVTNTGGSSRADMLEMMRTAAFIHPDRFTVPIDPGTGKPSFRLEKIAPANGYLPPEDAGGAPLQAHDAMADVHMLVHMARLMAERAPEIWNHLIDLATPAKVEHIILDPWCTLVEHFGSPVARQVSRLAACPRNPKLSCLFDLAYDPEPFLEMEADDLEKAIFGSPAEDGVWTRPHAAFRRIKTNTQPSVFSALDPLAPSPTLPIDPDAMVRTLSRIQMHPTFRTRVADALGKRARSFKPAEHVEQKLYDGFPSKEDRRLMEDFHRASSWEARKSIIGNFADQRLKDFGFRLVFEYAPELMAERTRDKFEEAVIRRRLLGKAGEASPWVTAAEFLTQLETLADGTEKTSYGQWIADKIDHLEARLARIAEARSEMASPSI
jgi:exodeoxyribonuclease-1